MKQISRLKKSWEETKLKLKRKFAILTNSDLLLEEGEKDELIIRLQLKLGKTKNEIRKLISKLKNNPSIDSTKPS